MINFTNEGNGLIGMKSRHVVEQIKNLIISQKMKVGEKLPNERSLAESLGVSRIIVREALSYLKACGIIESRHGSGNYVLKVPNDSNLQNGSMEYDLEEVIDARELLESTIARMFLKNVTHDMIQDMEYMVQSMEINFLRDDLKKVIESDVRFHQIFSKACGNSIIYSLLDHLTDYMKTKIWLFLKRDYLWDEEYQKRSIENHKRILKAISQGNQDELLRAIKVHYDTIRQHLEV